MAVGFHGEDSERIAELLEGAGARPFGRSGPSVVMPNFPSRSSRRSLAASAVRVVR